MQCENNSKYNADSKVILNNLKISFNSQNFVIRKYKENKNFVTYYDALLLSFLQQICCDIWTNEWKFANSSN